MARRFLPLVMLCFLPFGCKSNSSEAPAPPIINAIADFALTERNGTTITKSHLDGKVWIASFVFTRCTESCPQVTGTIARLQKELADVADVRFVTFTVDPERDNADELKRYAQNYQADPEKWLFLTGSEEKIKELLRESFHVDAIRNPNAKTPSQEIDHSSKLAVVDREGNIRGYFDGMRRTKSLDPEKEFEAEVAAVKSLVNRLLK